MIYILYGNSWANVDFIGWGFSKNVNSNSTHIVTVQNKAKYKPTEVKRMLSMQTKLQ